MENKYYVQVFEYLTCNAAGIAEEWNFLSKRARGSQYFLRTQSFSQRKLQQTMQVILMSQ